MKWKLPLKAVKPVCAAAVVTGLFFVVAGSWAAGLCMLLGAWILEKNLYRCPLCRHPLDMKRPLFRGARCPSCSGELNP